MNAHEALALLELPPSASPEQVRAKVRDQYRLWSKRVSTAPTVAGRQEAERRIEMLDNARQVLEARSSAPKTVPHQDSVPNGSHRAPWTTPMPPQRHPYPTTYNQVPQPQVHDQFPQPQAPQGWYIDGTNSWRCNTHQTVDCIGCYFPGRQSPTGLGPPKSRAAAGTLGLVLGSLGVHRFYLGYNGIGITMLLLTVLSFGLLWPLTILWGFIEGIVLLCGGMQEKNGRALQ